MMHIAFARAGSGDRERVFFLTKIEDADNGTEALYRLHGLLKKEGLDVTIGHRELEGENVRFFVIEIPTDVETDTDFKDLLAGALNYGEEEYSKYLNFLNMNP